MTPSICEPLVEPLRDVDRVLAGHRVGDEEHVLRRDRRLDRDELGHQRFVDVQAAGGVDDDGVVAAGARRRDAGAREVDRLRVGASTGAPGSRAGSPSVVSCSIAAGR